MSRLAASGSRVLFVESLGLRRPDLGSGRDLRRIAPPAAARTGAAEAARRRRSSVAARRPAALERARPRAERAPAAGSRSARGAALGLRAPISGAMYRRPRCCSTRSTPSSWSTTASTTSPPRRASTSPASTPPSSASPRGPTRPRLLAGARRADADAVGQRPVRAQRGRHRAVRGPRSTRARSTPSVGAARAADRLHRGDRGQEARSRAARGELARAAPRLDVRAGRSGRARRPRHRRLGARGAAERAPARRARPRPRCPTCSAAPRSALIPYRASRLTDEHLPDEGLRVPRRRAARGRHRAAGARGRQRGRPGRGAEDALAAVSVRSATTRPSAGAPAARPSATARGPPGSPRSERRWSDERPGRDVDDPDARERARPADVRGGRRARSRPSGRGRVCDLGRRAAAAEYRQLQNVTLRALRASRGPARMREFAGPGLAGSPPAWPAAYRPRSAPPLAPLRPTCA